MTLLLEGVLPSEGNPPMSEYVRSLILADLENRGLLTADLKTYLMGGIIPLKRLNDNNQTTTVRSA